MRSIVQRRKVTSLLTHCRAAAPMGAFECNDRLCCSFEAGHENSMKITLVSNLCQVNQMTRGSVSKPSPEAYRGTPMCFAATAVHLALAMPERPCCSIARQIGSDTG